MGSLFGQVAIWAFWPVYNADWRQRYLRSNSAQNINHPFAIEPTVTEVLSVIHLLRLYVLDPNQ
jgi:hypothetical protein